MSGAVAVPLLVDGDVEDDMDGVLSVPVCPVYPVLCGVVSEEAFAVCVAEVLLPLILRGSMRAPVGWESGAYPYSACAWMRSSSATGVVSRIDSVGIREIT